MRSIMDSIGSRLDEARDTGRYLVGLLVFLGLLGTFWGLLETIQSVGKAISALDTRAADSVAMFDDLKNGLAAPLHGMGTAFSSSLLGLGGSLVLGFLELQASHAHSRFYNQLEEWLSGITELTPGALATPADYVSRQLSAAIYDMQRAIADLTERLSGARRSDGIGGARRRRRSRQGARQGVDQLVRQMRAEQKVVREWVDEQAAQQSEVASVLKDLAANVARRGLEPWPAVAPRRRRSYGEFWPGYVDVLSTLLLVVTFLMSIFMVAQFSSARKRAARTPRCAG